jgi:hypothetical protein
LELLFLHSRAVTVVIGEHLADGHAGHRSSSPKPRKLYTFPHSLRL